MKQMFAKPANSLPHLNCSGARKHKVRSRFSVKNEHDTPEVKTSSQYEDFTSKIQYLSHFYCENKFTCT